MKVLAVVFTSRSDPSQAGARVALWLWPNVLNLDAPLVAVLWQFLLAGSTMVRLNPYEPWALGLAVWLIYIADHLIDTARPASGEWEPPRKTFFRRHWRKGFALGVAVGLALALCGSRLLRTSTMRGGLQLSFAVVGYFILTHLMPARWRIRWPREVLVALLFTLGTFGAVWLGNGRNFAPLAVPAAIFMLLCWMNCSLIETWEWEADGCGILPAPDGAARWATKHAGVVAGVIAWLALWGPSPFALAGVMSGAALWVLAMMRRRIAVGLVSPVADLALCSPIFVLVGGWLR
jgi:hypothetical protein